MKIAWDERKGAVCVWKTHLVCTQGSWKWVGARITCVVLPLAEYNTWYILPPAQREASTPSLPKQIRPQKKNETEACFSDYFGCI